MNEKLSKYSDEELLIIMKSSEHETEGAFTEIYARHSPKVIAYCRSMIGSGQQAEDIFQETFIRFFNGARAEGEYINVAGYLMKTARNLCLNYLRDKKQTVALDEFANQLTDNKVDEENELFDLIMRSLELLDVKYKEAFIMREIEGFAYKKIAELTNTSLSNAKSRVQRAREKLIEILQPYLKDMLSY